MVWKLLLTKKLQAGVVLRDFFLWDFALMQFANLHRFSNLHDNFQFNAIWCTWSVAALIFYSQLAESDVTAHQLWCVWLYYFGDIITQFI
jgi:hypothetical protein